MLHAAIACLRHRLTPTPRGTDRIPARKGFRPSLDVAVRTLRDTDAELSATSADPTTTRIPTAFYRGR